MLAGCASREEILADYTYLEDADNIASLEYASRAIDHRVIAAAESAIAHHTTLAPRPANSGSAVTSTKSSMIA